MEGTIGEIRMFGGTFAPQGWAFCDGSMQSIYNYQAAYAILGTTYGGDGRQTFALPDLRGRVPVGVGQGAGLSYVALGEKGGEESHTLTNNELPGHTHAAITSGTGNTVKVSSAPGSNSVTNANDSIAAMVTGTGRTANAVKAFNDAAPNTTLNAASVTLGGTMTVAAAGGNQSHSNMQPSIALQYIICLEGIFPSRN